jgi:hypothetical protein
LVRCTGLRRSHHSVETPPHLLVRPMSTDEAMTEVAAVFVTYRAHGRATMSAWRWTTL